MEVKSNNVMIGSFAIAVICGAFLFALWISKLSLTDTDVYYKIVFDGSISGLTEAGPVYYNGIPVGRVTSLKIDETDSSKVVALVKLDPNVRVKEDSVAQLQYTGLTGIAYIEITGGSPESPLLKAEPGEPYPVIAVSPSAFQQLFSGAPDAVQNANELILQLRRLVGANSASVNKILKDMSVVSGSLAARSNDLDETIGNIHQISGDLAATTARLNSLATQTDELMRTDGKAFVAEARAAAKSYREVADSLDALMDRNGPALDKFARDGLGQLPTLISESRALVASLDRFIQRAEGDPARFLLGKDAPEYEPRRP